MQYQAILNLILTAVVAFVVAAIGKILVDPRTIALAEALAAKLGAETEKEVALAETSNNALLAFSIHAAMSYAEAHEAEILKKFNSKADYVISTIDADPRFAHMNLPLSAFEHLLQQMFESYFAALPHKTASAPAAVIPKPLTL